MTLARATAQKHGESAKLAEALKKLVERSTRRKDDAPLASDLLMSLADILENDVRDLAACNAATFQLYGLSRQEKAALGGNGD